MTRRLINNLIIVPFMVSMGVVHAGADDLDRLRGAVVDQLLEMESQYGRVAMTAEETTFDPEGEVVIRYRHELAASGGQFAGMATVLESTREHLPIGQTQVRAGSPERIFQLSRSPEAAEFEIVRVGPSTQEYFDLVFRNLLKPLFAPFSVFNEDLVEFINSNETRATLGEPAEREGRRAVVFVLDFTPVNDNPENNTFRYFLHFDETTNVFLGHRFTRLPEGPETGQAWQWHTYDFDHDPPVLQRIDNWGEFAPDHPTRAGERVRHMEIIITDLTFGPVPAERFTLEGYGVERPGGADDDDEEGISLPPGNRRFAAGADTLERSGSDSGGTSGGFPRGPVMLGAGVLAAAGIAFAVASVRSRNRTV